MNFRRAVPIGFLLGQVIPVGSLSTEVQGVQHELAALHAHAALDHAEGTDRGWAAKTRVLHARLSPPGLDPDPLATVERLADRKSRRGRLRDW